jgi:hypothetical protein
MKRELGRKEKEKTTLDHKYQIFSSLYEAKNRGGSNIGSN